MKKILRLLAGLILIAVLLAACGGFGVVEPTQDPGPTYTVIAQTLIAGFTESAPLPADTATSPPPTAPALPTDTQLPPTPTSPPTPQPAATTAAAATLPAPESMEILFQDDFSTEDNWVDQRNEDWAATFVDGAYRMLVNFTNDAIWSVKSFDLADAVMEVDAARTAGPENGYYGLTCRHQDGENYYLLVIGSNGFYGIGIKEEGRITFLQEGMAPPEILRRGAETNRLRAGCLGDSLTLAVNGTRLLEVQDSTFGAGDIGMVAGTQEQEGLEVVFDNFLLYGP